MRTTNQLLLQRGLIKTSYGVVEEIYLSTLPLSRNFIILYQKDFLYSMGYLAWIERANSLAFYARVSHVDGLDQYLGDYALT